MAQSDNVLDEDTRVLVCSKACGYNKGTMSTFRAADAPDGEPRCPICGSPGEDVPSGPLLMNTAA